MALSGGEQGRAIQPQLEPLLSSPPTGAALAPIITALPAATQLRKAGETTD
jgi:hypothetical protein